MPQDQGKLRHLLPLLAKLKQRSLPSTFVEEIRDVSHSPAVLLAHVVGGILSRRLLLRRRRCRDRRGLLLLMLLLLSGLLGLLSLLSLLGLLLLLRATVLLDRLLLLLLVHPGRVGLRVELVVPVQVRHHVRVWPLHACGYRSPPRRR